MSNSKENKIETTNSIYEKMGLNAVLPYEGEINPQEVVHELEGVFKKYLYLPQYAETVIALWVLHTYKPEEFDYTPRLFVYSPEPRCGKSTLLDLLELLCNNALKTENISAAAFYNLAESCKPTLLIDEADTFFKSNNELRGAIDSGYKCNGSVIRMMGDKKKEPVAYNCFAPCAIAGIGKIHQTILDRSIVIHMQRGLPNELPEKLRIRQAESEVKILRRKCAKLMESVHQNNDVVIPNGLNSRQENSWESLLTIAEHISEEYAENVRKIAQIYSASIEVDSDVSIRIALLQDIKGLFERRKNSQDVFLSSQDMCKELSELEEQPWSEFNHGKAITPRNIASLLKYFGITPEKQSFAETSRRGYKKHQFEDTFLRYLPAEQSEQSKKSDTENNPTALKPSANLADGQKVG